MSSKRSQLVVVRHIFNDFEAHSIIILNYIIAIKYDHHCYLDIDKRKKCIKDSFVLNILLSNKEIGLNTLTSIYIDDILCVEKE